MERRDHPSLEYFRWAYRDSKAWDGKTPGCKLIVYMEQGFGDIIQFLRYIEPLQCDVTVHCPTHLHRLIESQNWGVNLLDKESPELPDHDYHVLSFDIPSLFANIIPTKPYLKVEAHPDVQGGVGICWEAGPRSDKSKNCPLKHFTKIPDKLYSLQFKIHDYNLIEGAEEAELWGVELKDFYDTARLIESLDYVVSIDTSVLHLAGAMGKKTFGLLSHDYDERWNGSWYPTIQLIGQKNEGNWASVFRQLKTFI